MKAGADPAPLLRWVDVLEAEDRALGGPPPDEPLPADPDERLRALHARRHDEPRTALCLSGGGIRSATFALGVLQGLAHIGALGRFDYLSTVSGGGYTGGWFTAWLRRDDRTAVLRDLDPASAALRRGGGEAPAVEHLRQTCRYLAPRGGFVSADMWAMLATLARNLFLNWLILLPLLAASLLVPRLYYAIVSAVESDLTAGPCLTPDAPSLWFLMVASAAFATAGGYAALNFTGAAGRWSQGRFLACFLAPVTIGALAITLFWSAYPCDLDLRWTLALGALVPAMLWFALGRSKDSPHERRGSDLFAGRQPGTILGAAVAGAIIGAGAWWFAMHPFGFGTGEPLREIYAVTAVPIVLALMILAITLFAGLASNALDDAALEWWSRCAGWLGIAAVTWVVAAGLVFYMADLLDAALHQLDLALSLERRTSATVFATLVPLLSSLVGLAARPAAGPGRGGVAGALLYKLALPLTILALLSSIAWIDLRAVERLEYHRNDAGLLCTPLLAAGDDGCHPVGAGVGEVLVLGAGLTIFGLVMSWFVPTNRFSLHGMYRQRLIRTFLGASRRDRSPNAFTGFDRHDDLTVHDLRDVRPLHVVNATLNAVSATHVGRHERQAESFTFTPLHAGNDSVGYRPAAAYGSDGGGPGSGLSLGMALAVSGAAASSSMGIYSSKTRAFLLTLANARLGLWFGNPASATTWQRSDPPLGVGPLLRELLGLTTDHNPYVYLSDGGHYENLGLWEMVARRCRFIVVSDAGCDPDYRFDDLSNAARRIRLDLGVPIEFPRMTMSRERQGRGNPHAAIGVVRYSVVDGPAAPDGTILYLKATLSGDEPVDVWNFAQVDPAFPHDSTGDQFFDEPRFESYRALGFHTVLSAAPEFEASQGIRGLCDAASRYVERTAAPSTTPAGAAAGRGAAPAG